MHGYYLIGCNIKLIKYFERTGTVAQAPYHSNNQSDAEFLVGRSPGMGGKGDACD